MVRAFSPLLPALALPVLLSAACAPDVEGDEAEECRDGADNDQNGYFDCVDLGCERSPDCADSGGADTGGDDDSGGGDSDGGDSGGDSGGGDSGGGDSGNDTGGDSGGDSGGGDSGGGDTGGDTGGALTPADLLTVTVTMTVLWTFPTGGYEDCEQTFAGDGTQSAAEPGWVAFDGTWDRLSSDCHEDLDYPLGVWFPASGEAYTMFDFDPTMTELEAWYANDSQTDSYARAKWKIFAMGADFDPADPWVHYSEAGGDGKSVVTNFLVDIAFNE